MLIPWREGWYFQAGYLFSGIDLDPVARYEQHNQDTKAIEKTEEVWTIGANWYTKGHSLKISALDPLGIRETGEQLAC